MAMALAKKKEVEKYLSELGPDTKFTSFKEKNRRGDYGYDEVFMVGAMVVMRISIDGARSDVRVYINK